MKIKGKDETMRGLGLWWKMRGENGRYMNLNQGVSMKAFSLDTKINSMTYLHPY